MSQKKKSWEKRLAGGPAEKTIDFVESLSYDTRLYKYDIDGSIAHAKMLCKQELISKDELNQITDGLSAISQQIEAGKFEFDTEKEDIHMAIEAALVERIGQAGLRLHTGRSRNDQVATDIRLWMRDAISQLQQQIRDLQRAFVTLAEKHIEDLMPSYTHLQRAQPINIASYLLSFVEQLQRDFARLGDCAGRVNVSPLGCGAIAGSTLPIDRDQTVELLGFDGLCRNSIDGVSDRDFCVEFVFDCSMIMMHLSRLAEDLIIYSTSEFGFIRIADSYCTSSSMMPQKRNPDILELIRAKTGGAYGSLVSILTILKALPSGYNRDLQEDKIHVFSAGDSAAKSLDMVCAVIENISFNVSKIGDGMEDGFLDATAMAEYLVGKGVAFRQAHGIVGQLVSYCEKTGRRLADLSLEEFREFSEAISDDVCQAIGVEEIVNCYRTEGAGGPAQAKKQIEYWNKLLAEK
jgi:argininosuccinate lyase